MLQYYITHTLEENTTTSDTTNDTRYIFPTPVELLEPFNFTLVAENVLGNTTLHNGTLSEFYVTIKLH